MYIYTMICLSSQLYFKYIKIFFLTLFLCLPLAISAQSFYFDVGMGIGKAWTKIDGIDIEENIKNMWSGNGVYDISADFSLKAGYGGMVDIPLYIVGELSGLWHIIRDDDHDDTIVFNTYVIGPGIIYYPDPMIQIGTSIGYSWVANDDKLSLKKDDSLAGYSFNITFAFELGKKNHGCLIGIKYVYANNTLRDLLVPQTTAMVGFFVKYIYRDK